MINIIVEVTNFLNTLDRILAQIYTYFRCVAPGACADMKRRKNTILIRTYFPDKMQKRLNKWLNTDGKKEERRKGESQR